LHIERKNWRVDSSRKHPHPCPLPEYRERGKVTDDSALSPRFLCAIGGSLSRDNLCFSGTLKS
jgi:hypothetical protein